MANSAAFACSIFMLIVCLSYTDGHWNDERPIDERSNAERRNNERSNDEKRDDNSSEEDKRSDDKRRKVERRNDGSSEEDKISNNERRNDEKRDDDSSEEDKRSNNKRRNDEKRDDDSSEEDKRSNNERRNDEKRDDDSSEEDKRSNNERRNDEKRDDDSSEEDKRSNNERRNDEKRDDDSSEEDKRSNDERRNDERWNPILHPSPLRKIYSDEKRDDDSSEEDRLSSFADKCAADKKENWSYRGNNGPLTWTRRYSACGGRKQSPIAINSYKAVFHEEIEKLKFENYHIPVERATIGNNGHTIHMTPADDVERVIHFKSRTYRLKQLHFHWGNNKNDSSEHTIDFIHYALEMHLIHQSGSGRTAVVAVFFKEQRQACKELQNIIQKFPKLMYKDNCTEFISRINLNNLLPANPASYYSYEGSLTTPPCTEGVQWLLLPKIMAVGTKQMGEFRKLYSSSKADSNEHCKISNNYRPLQSLNGRTVVISQ